MSCWSDWERSASHVRLRVTTPKKCVRECLSVHISRSDCHSPIVKSTNTKTIFLRYLICVATTRRFEFVSFFFFKNECRDIRCDRLLSLSLCLWWKILMKVTMVFEDDDEHWSASGCEDCFFLVCKLFVFSVFFGLHGVVASSSEGLNDFVFLRR